MSTLGKTFVFAILMLSLILCTYATVTFAQPINWGWKPEFTQKDLGKPVPSELDKRKAAIKELGEAKERALAAWTAARAHLAKTEAGIARNQLQYALELQRTKNGKSFEKVDDLKKEKPWLFEVNDRTKKPFFDGEATKSYDDYVTVLNGLLTEIRKSRSEIEKAIAKEKVISVQLNGEDDNRGKRQIGLFGLIALEENVQRRVREELDDLKPLYFQEMVDSQLFLKRQESLLYRVDQLKSLDGEKN